MGNLLIQSRFYRLNRKWIWTKLEIHPLFWLIGALSIITAQFESVFIIFVLVFLHECAHILIMMKFKWKIQKIVLLPFGGVAQTDEFATRPSYEEWYVVLAGPMFHVVLECGFLIAIYLFHLPAETVFQWRQMNQMILLVNLLPVYPLDGGRLLTLVLEQYFPYYFTFMGMVWFSILSCVGCISFFILFQQTSLGNIFVFIYLIVYLYMIWRRRTYIFLRFLYMRIDGEQLAQMGLPTRVISAQLEEKILRVCKRLYRPAQHRVYLYEENGVREIPEQTLLNTYLHQSFEPKTMREARKYFQE